MHTAVRIEHAALVIDDVIDTIARFRKPQDALLRRADDDIADPTGRGRKAHLVTAQQIHDLVGIIATSKALAVSSSR